MTRRRTNTPPSRRSRARLPTWAVAALLLLAGSVALGRTSNIGPFAVPDATAPTVTAPTVTAPAATAPAATVPAATIPAATPADAQLARVVRIIDGDTIDVEIEGESDGERFRVRYIGIDTPERDEPGYQAATAANRALIEGRPLYLVRDQSETDVFDRLLRYLYLADGTHVNAELIAQGWAQPVEYPPDTRHAAEFRQLAVEAADAQRGFWMGDRASAAGENEPVDGVMRYGITESEAPIRRGPGSQFDVNTTVPPRTPLSIYGRTPAGDWLQVRPPSRNGGWIETAAVDVRVPLEEIPIEE